MKHTKLLIAIIAFIILPVGSYIIFKKRNAKKLQWYLVDKPIRKDLTQYVTAAGRLKPQDQITIGSLEAGRVVKLLVDDNDFVKKDQVLAELDNGIGYSAVKKAKATLYQAKAVTKYLEAFYSRQKILYESGQLAKDMFEQYTKDYESSQAQVLQSEAELEIQQQIYDNLFIKSPVDGVIIARKIDLGQMITAQFQATVMFIIAKDLTKMEAEIDVDEADIGLVKQGQEAIFTVDAFPQIPFRANVKEVHYDYKVTENVISYAIILDVANPDLTLRPGMTTNVDLKVAEAKNALCIPNKALRLNKVVLKKLAEKEGFTFSPLPQTIETKIKESVWILENKTTLKEVHITLGVADGKFRQVLSGITEETIIVIEALDPERENPILSMGRLRV